MNRKSALLWALMAVFALTLTPVSTMAASPHRTLKVKLHYTGAEKVNQKDKIYVLLFDANPFTATSLVDTTGMSTPPAREAGVCHILRRQGAVGKNETLTFNNVGLSPVYAAAFVDKDGSYDGHGDPPHGSPLGVYCKTPGKAEPISLKEGKTARVVLTFDDSSRTP